MTATQCAAELEISIAAWSQYEKAKRDPPLSDLPKICWMFRCSADQLLGLKDRNDTPKQVVSVKAGNGGIAIGGIGNRVSGTIVADRGDAGHAVICKSCPYRKKVQAMEKVLGK